MSMTDHRSVMDLAHQGVTCPDDRARWHSARHCLHWMRIKRDRFRADSQQVLKGTRSPYALEEKENAVQS